MATVTGLTAARMKVIEDASVVSGVVVGDDLVLTTRGGTNINAGDVRGPQGEQGPLGGGVVGWGQSPYTNQVLAGGIAATMTDLTGLSYTWTADPTRLYRVSYSFGVSHSPYTSAGIYALLRDNVSNVIYQHYHSWEHEAGFTNLTGFFLETGLSGTITRKISVYWSKNISLVIPNGMGGFGNQRSQMIIEDMGSGLIS